MTSIQSPSSPIKYPDVVFPVEVNTFTLDYYKIDKVYDVLPKGEFTIVIIGRAFLPNGAQIFHLKMTGLNDDLGRVFVFWVTENAARGAFLIDPYILSNYEKYYGKVGFYLPSLLFFSGNHTMLLTLLLSLD